MRRWLRISPRGTPPGSTASTPNSRRAGTLEKDAAFARRLGYTGKAAIHPRQLDIINRVFTPSAEELAYYERVVVAMRDAHARGLGAVAIDGRMVDQAMLERALSVIQTDPSSRVEGASKDCKGEPDRSGDAGR